jgi:hypothetical protein
MLELEQLDWQTLQEQDLRVYKAQSGNSALITVRRLVRTLAAALEEKEEPHQRMRMRTQICLE